MGGHGGLNILPQKRWNVYRRDNKEKVARDEAEDARRREEDEARKRSHALDKNIRRLRRRNDTPAEDECAYREENFQSGECDERGRPAGHFNLFAEEERQFTSAQERHCKYLAEVSHNHAEESDFDRIARTMDTPWYLKSQRDVSWDFTSSSPSVVEKRPETMMPPTTTSSVYKSNSSIYEATTAQPSCEEKKNSKLKSSAVSSNDHTSLVGSPKKSHHRHHRSRRKRAREDESDGKTKRSSKKHRRFSKEKCHIHTRAPKNS